MNKSINLITDTKGALLAIIHGEDNPQHYVKGGPESQAGIILKSDQKLTKVALTDTLAKLKPTELHNHIAKNIQEFVKK